MSPRGILPTWRRLEQEEEREQDKEEEERQEDKGARDIEDSPVSETGALLVPSTLTMLIRHYQVASTMHDNSPHVANKVLRNVVISFHVKRFVCGRWRSLE